MLVIRVLIGVGLRPLVIVLLGVGRISMGLVNA